MNEKTYLYMIQRLENKLREYMTDQEYMDFSIMRGEKHGL